MNSHAHRAYLDIENLTEHVINATRLSDHSRAHAFIVDCHPREQVSAVYTKSVKLVPGQAEHTSINTLKHKHIYHMSVIPTNISILGKYLFTILIFLRMKMRSKYFNEVY